MTRMMNPVLKLQTLTFSYMKTTEKSRSNSIEFRQHWIVWFLTFSRRDRIVVNSDRVHYEHRRLFAFRNKDYIHPRQNTTVQSFFQNGNLWTWFFTVPVMVIGALFGTKVPIGYGKIILHSESGHNEIKYIVNHKRLVKLLADE